MFFRSIFLEAMFSNTPFSKTSTSTVFKQPKKTWGKKPRLAASTVRSVGFFLFKTRPRVHVTDTELHHFADEAQGAHKPQAKYSENDSNLRFGDHTTQKNVDTPWKINMEHNHEGLEDRFPFPIG